SSRRRHTRFSRDWSSDVCSSDLAPADVAQVQAVLRIANQFRIPLWPISRGKNFGYGGASPRMPGTVILDLGRMNRIIEVNEKLRSEERRVGKECRSRWAAKHYET